MAYSNLGNSVSSLTQDSDEVKEMYCEHCHIHEHKYKPAAGFCVDCVDYLCDTCLKYHRRYAPNHSMQDKDSMPQDFCFEKCSMHTNQIVKFFCENCQNFPCAECKSTSHQNCANISHLPRLVQGIENSTELKDLSENLKKLSQEIEQTKEQVDHNFQRVVTQETKILTETRKFKENLMVTYKSHQHDIIDTFDQKMKETIAKLIEKRTNLVELEAEKQKEFEKKLRDDETSVTHKVSNTRGSDQLYFQIIKDKSVTIKKDLKTLSLDLVQQQNSGQRCKLFMMMKKGLQEKEKLKHCLDKLKRSNDMHIYKVKTEVKEYDVLSLQNAKEYFSYKDLPSSKQNRSAIHQSDIHVKVTERQCSSLCLLDENTLLVAVFKDNLLVFIRNVNKRTESSTTIDMASGPWDITKIDENKVAVTFPLKGFVRLITFYLFYSMTVTVISTDDIKVGAQCHGIAYSNNNLIVSYTTNPGMVQILDMSGNVLKCFDKDCNGQSLFGKLYYLTLSPDNTTIYVSDWFRNTVISMTLDGKVKATYRDYQLCSPNQLTVDESGAVYVCGWMSHNVHQLSSDLDKVKILLDEEQGIKCPRSVAYCQNNNRLYVGTWISSSSCIKVFNLSLE